MKLGAKDKTKVQNKNDTSYDYKMFLKFYNENKSKLRMPIDENHRLNYEKAMYWVNSQCDKESRDFAESIIKNTIYVSFKKFMKQLKLVCDSYIKASKKMKDKNSVLYVFMIPFSISKSNIWVSLLAFEYLKDIIDDVAYDITHIYNKTLDIRSKFYQKNVRCIVCDDCSYTGHQLNNLSTLDHSRIKYPNKPSPPDVYSKEWSEWYDRIDLEAGEYIDKISTRKFSVDLVLPYMSTLAKDRLEKKHYIRLPKDCNVFPIFSQQVDMDKIPEHIRNEFTSTFQYHKEISAIYFDHKVADAISTFQKIYLLAPLFSCAESFHRVGFIENCNDKVIPNNINIYDYNLDLKDALGKDLCPSSFYKGIKYTFNNRHVDNEMSAEILFSKNKKDTSYTGGKNTIGDEYDSLINDYCWKR